MHHTSNHLFQDYVNVLIVKLLIQSPPQNLIKHLLPLFLREKLVAPEAASNCLPIR